MAARSVSPGGALLRTSRMFSLPAPIPPPPGDFSAGTYHGSDTATLNFPTHQVITTLSSSRKVGDWGLKRPLPLKSTTKSWKPMLRIRAIDTIEQITDFTSGADHGITLRKFQELHMPITVRRTSDPYSSTSSSINVPHKSVFEDEIDMTDIPPEKRAEAVHHRWKFSGPWLAGMSEGEFKNWLAEKVRPRRPEFRRFLKAKIASEMNAAASLEATEQGEAPPAPIDARSITEDQLTEYLRKLRHDNQQLYDMVGQFLDLAPLKPPTMANSGLPRMSNKMDLREMKNPYAEHGPPVTHPSAGISYLRTSMYMENHPIYGPQRDHRPVVARVVRPRRQNQGLPAKLGVAGFIVDTPAGDTVSNAKSNDNAALTRIDPTIEGGAKTWVQPLRAAVDSQGRVVLTVTDSAPVATLIAQELLGEATCLGAQRAEDQALNRRETASDIRRRYRAADVPTMSSAVDYGLQGSPRR
ncbi:hypothetical protein VTK56DRAFT_7524 [Thermocarpiscus australiensis]